MNTRSGYTLLEVMASVAILVIVSGMLFTLAQALHSAALTQEAKLTAQDDARAGMDFVVRQVRQSSGASIAGLPGAALRYRIADDTDGNGLAVDVARRLELSTLRTLGRDTTDANGDGRTTDQLVMIADGVPRVVANGLLTNEDVNGTGTLDAGEDANGNGVLDRGVWFERDGQAIRITIQAQRPSGPNGLVMTSTLTENIVPRN